MQRAHSAEPWDVEALRETNRVLCARIEDGDASAWRDLADLSSSVPVSVYRVILPHPPPLSADDAAAWEVAEEARLQRDRDREAEAARKREARMREAAEKCEAREREFARECEKAGLSTYVYYVKEPYGPIVAICSSEEIADLLCPDHCTVQCVPMNERLA